MQANVDRALYADKNALDRLKTLGKPLLALSISRQETPLHVQGLTCILGCAAWNVYLAPHALRGRELRHTRQLHVFAPCCHRLFCADISHLAPTCVLLQQSYHVFCTKASQLAFTWQPTMLH